MATSTTTNEVALDLTSLGELTEIAWSASVLLRAEVHHGDGPVCTTLADRGCRGACADTVGRLVPLVARRVPVTGRRSRADWRREATRTAQWVCDLARRELAARREEVTTAA